MKRSLPLKRRTTKVHRCEDCGTEFERRSDWKPRAADGKTRCDECNISHRSRQRLPSPERRTGTVKPCEECGRDYYRSASRAGRFCSNECRLADQARREPPAALMTHRPDNRGENNGRYKHGQRVGQHAKYEPKNKVRQRVVDRDGDWCLLCGRPGPGLHLHRVVYGSQGGRYEVGNCVQLCGDHHGTVHSSKRTWLTPLLAYLDEPSDDRRRALVGLLA